MSSPKRAVVFLGGVGIDAIVDMGFWGCELGGMEEIKKSGGGDVRAGALSRATIGDKAENGFSVFPQSRPRWLAALATHIPRRPKKKPLRGEKVGYAEKKLPRDFLFISIPQTPPSHPKKGTFPIGIAFSEHHH